MINFQEARIPYWLAVEHEEVIANPANLLNASSLVSLEIDWSSSVTCSGITVRPEESQLL